MDYISNIKAKNIMVIGDIMLDTYFIGEVKRISPEAPVPIFKKRDEQSLTGGAANVAANLIAAGQHVSIMAMIGKDKAGEKLKSACQEKGIDVNNIISVDRNTTVKTRFLANNNQQILRFDVEDTDELSSYDLRILSEVLEKEMDNYELIILSDYLKGFLNYEFTQSILQMAKRKNIPAIVDVKEAKIDKYEDAYLLKPNLAELRSLTGMPAINDSGIIEASEFLRKKSNAKYVLTTCGARGMVLVGEDEPYFIESVGREVFDVTGAGDTAIAYLAACIVNGIDIKKAVNIANCAAGIQVSRLGTSIVCWQEISEYYFEKSEGTTHKLLDSKALDDFREKNRDKKIVFTNGCFDIVHIGHVRYLQEAAKLGDILVIGLNSDESVRRLKGMERPVNPEVDRAELLCAFDFVDYVVNFNEDTPMEILKKIQPDILVKGGDYRNEYVVGTREVEDRGGKLVLLPFIEGKSTTTIIERLKQQ